MIRKRCTKNWVALEQGAARRRESLAQFSDQGFQSVDGELRAVECCRRQAAEGIRKRFRSQIAGFGDVSPADLFCQERRAGNGGGATATEEAGFVDMTIHDA